MGVPPLPRRQPVRPHRQSVRRPVRSACLALSLTVAGWLPQPAPAELPALPEPLTLEHALSLADDPHPDLLAAAADRDVARAERDLAASATGLNASVNAQAKWIEPSEFAFDQSHNDSQAHLRVRKRLYDFGHTRASVAAAEALLDSRQLRYADARQQRRLDILERYLDVLLADLEFRVQDEAMAIAFVRLDRIRDQHELRQVSDVELLDSETRYEETRSARYRAQARQRTARVRLAEALHRPGQLSNTLAEPDLGRIAVEPPPLEDLVAEVLQANPRIQALRAEAESARERLQAARAADRPVLLGAAEASEYARKTGSTDPWSIGLELEVPLYTGGRSGAERARARALLRRTEADIAAAELELRQDVQALWEEINILRAGRDEARTRVEFRELFLDRSRALYEMEAETNLGDAMVFSTEARLREAQLDYQLLLNWARLDLLRGRTVAVLDGEPEGKTE